MTHEQLIKKVTNELRHELREREHCNMTLPRPGLFEGYVAMSGPHPRMTLEEAVAFAVESYLERP